MNNSTDLKLGDHIKSLRKKRKLTREQLAEGICSVSHISRIESSNRQPSSILLVQIAKRLGVTPDYLLSDIESENATEIHKFMDKLILMIERQEFQSIYDTILVSDSLFDNRHIDISLLDRQIIEVLRLYSFHMLNGNYVEGLKGIDPILNMTYVLGNVPTEIEFAIMELKGFFLLMNNQLEASYKYMMSIEPYISQINFIRTNFIIPRYYSHLIMICLDTGRLDQANEYVDYAVYYCKHKNTQHHLRELYYLKSELLMKLGNKEESKLWYDKSFLLHDLIKTSDKEFFVEFVNHREHRL